jgi:type II secretory pathway pseudopilin PulG
MSAKVSRRLRNALVVVLVLAVLAAVAKLVASLAYHRSTSELLKRNIDGALQAELEAVRAEGLPVTFAELDKWYVSPPASENAATVLQEAFALYAKPAPRPRFGRQEEAIGRSRLPIIGSPKSPPVSEPLSDDTKASIAEVLAQNEAALKLLHKGASMTACRYPIDLTQGFEVRLPHLNKLREGANLLSLEMLLRAENGQSELAVESACSCFGLAGSLVNEPVVISQLTRFNCQTTAAWNLGRVLTKVTLTDEQLTRLESALTQAENMEGLTRAYVNDRCKVLFGYDLARKETPESVRLWPTLEELRQLSWRDAYYFHAFRMEDRRRATSGLFELEVLTSLELRTACIRASQRPFPEQIPLAKRLESQELNVSSFLMMPAATRAMLHQAKCVASLRVARAALAIERYRLANARLPDTLPDSAPLDPFTGQPLRYKKLAKGYVVYSIGEDGKDDGGDEKKDITFTVER